jgi:hypothetical protein
MKLPCVLSLALFALAAAPAPLTVGSVRDQDGAPIAGANISLAGSAASARTAADGTFALEATGSFVEIRCDYCQVTRVPVAADGTVTAVVRRYDAVRLEGPSASDIASLPYAHAESDVALTPFVVLQTSTHPLVGVRLEDRSISLPGGLLVLDGVPDYDSAGDLPTLGTIPYGSAASIDVDRAPQAYAYGDIAQSGTFEVNTLGAPSSVAAGADSQADASSNAYAAGYSYGTGDARARATAAVPLMMPDAAGTISLSSGSGQSFFDTSTLDSSFSALQASLEHTQGTDVYGSFTADRGSNVWDASSPFHDTWSDVDAQLGIRSHATIAPFAQVDARQSSGWIAPAGNGSSIAGDDDQLRVFTGVSATLPWSTTTVAYGQDAVRFADGAPTTPESFSANGHDASASIDLHPASTWDLEASSSSGYILPDLVGYNYFSATALFNVPIDDVSTDELDLTYHDLQRLRFGFTTFETRATSGIDDRSTGIDAAWQISPSISLRTWWLNVRPATGSAQNVGSAWLTANTGSIRVDLIWRRDLLDFIGDAHVDGSISGPVGKHEAWFIHTERYAGTRLSDIGIRF